MGNYTLPWPIVGLSGQAGCGKDTVASYLARRTAVHRIALAAPLREAINTLFRLDARLWDNREWKETPNEALCGRDPRYLLQTLGTEWGRGMVHEDIWVRIAAQRAEVLRLQRDWPVVITDVRFPNEARWIHEQEGVVVAILRPGLNRGDHASETQTLASDITIENTGSLSDLETQVKTMLLVKDSVGNMA